MAKRENSEERYAFMHFHLMVTLSDKSAFPPNGDVTISPGNVYTNEIIYNPMCNRCEPNAHACARNVKHLNRHIKPNQAKSSQIKLQSRHLAESCLST